VDSYLEIVGVESYTVRWEIPELEQAISIWISLFLQCGQPRPGNSEFSPNCPCSCFSAHGCSWLLNGIHRSSPCTSEIHGLHVLIPNSRTDGPYSLASQGVLLLALTSGPFNLIFFSYWLLSHIYSAVLKRVRPRGKLVRKVSTHYSSQFRGNADFDCHEELHSGKIFTKPLPSSTLKDSIRENRPSHRSQPRGSQPESIVDP